MHKKIFYISICLSIFLFNGCSNRTVAKDSSAKKQNETITESSVLGKIFFAGVTLWGTKGNVGKAIKASKFGGTASGYFVGKKLSDMQKRYKEKEEALIANILKIDEESTALKEKSNQLETELVSMKEKIDTLQSNKTIKESQKREEKTSIKLKLEEKKKNLRKLLEKNKAVSKKISLSKNKANKYEYTKEDKKEILKSVAFLEKSSKSYQDDINKNISSIDSMISTL